MRFIFTILCLATAFAALPACDPSNPGFNADWGERERASGREQARDSVRGRR
jgi:hypothetical protein